MSGQYNGSVQVGLITVAGTPGDNRVDLGFVPGSIRFTVLSGTDKGMTATWNSEMADAELLIQPTDAVANSFVTANGVTRVTANTDGQKASFILGAAVSFADVGSASISYECFREAP